MTQMAALAPGRSTVTAHPVAPAIGAELRRIDLSQTLDGPQWQSIHDALMAHQVIFVRDQSLSKDDLVRFARRFGEPQPASESSFGKLAGYPEIDVLDYGGGKVPYVTKELWHTDFTGRERPTMGSVLYAVEAPDAGGDTIWVSLIAAYNALSDRMKHYLAGMSAEHRTIKAFGDDIRSNLWTDDAGRKRLQELQRLPPAMHPVVRTHPVTGHKALFINEGYTTRLIGVERAESDAVLGYLFHHLRTPEFQCRWRWRRGDLAVWDNRCTSHYAVADYSERRVMHRITIKGDKPV